MKKPRQLTAIERDHIRHLYRSTEHLPMTIPNPERWSLGALGKLYGVSREAIRRVLAEGDTDAAD